MADDEDTMQLLRRASQGDREALGEVLERHRGRLRQMVALRIDPRLSSRVDPSDVVQETLAEAAQQLPEYLGPLHAPFYLWLRQLAWRRLLDLSRKHLGAQRRSIGNEVEEGMPLPEGSALQLASRLAAVQTSPSRQAERKELRSQVRAALARLEPADQEVLVLRYLEELSASEIAAILGITERAVRYRQRVAMERLARLLGHPDR